MNLLAEVTGDSVGSGAIAAVITVVLVKGLPWLQAIWKRRREDETLDEEIKRAGWKAVIERLDITVKENRDELKSLHAEHTECLLNQALLKATCARQDLELAALRKQIAENGGHH